MKDNNGLLIASLVAIVAIVGLVILFSGGGAEGALNAPGQVKCPSGYQLSHFVGSHGGMSSYVCQKPAPVIGGMLTAGPQEVHCPQGYELKTFLGGSGHMKSWTCHKEVSNPWDPYV